jgi:peptidoglycan hydrolase CwlO-like protein
VKVTWKEIMAGALSTLILSAVIFVFSSTNTRITTLETLPTRVEKVELTLSKDLQRSIDDLTEQLDDVSSEINLYKNNQNSMDRAIDRIEILIERVNK